MGFINQFSFIYPNTKIESSDQVDPFLLKLAKSGEARIKVNVVYDPAYYKIPYPNGDVPSDKGVCTDVIIRSYRTLNIDLQERVHEDMKDSFWSYPKMWRLLKPDTNIDHRRVPNLMTFFKRHGKVLPKSPKSSDYKPGDIITWNLGGGTMHIGLVSSIKSHDKKNFMIVHNIGSGPKLENVLFKWGIIGHFNYK